MFYAPYENLSFFDLLHTVLSYMWKSLILLCFSHLITPHVKILILLCFTDRFTPRVKKNFGYVLHTVLPNIYKFIFTVIVYTPYYPTYETLSYCYVLHTIISHILTWNEFMSKLLKMNSLLFCFCISFFHYG